ncbi:uncharacterized protein [Saccopteryx leptura]|uniref:uncharacterized protein n=1 Tax=Saccopteryx leptura TaxID=249018 RepID=UPI00339C7C8B
MTMKFQQKALKQTKQKQSKSAEFLMVKEDRGAMEGIGNPAFNMSSPNLSAYQTSGKRGIRHDVLDHTLAAHQQKLRLLASTVQKGNEYSRNYFDPLMDEEINLRQCGMEVSREVCLKAKAEKAESGVEKTKTPVFSGKGKQKNLCASMVDEAKSSLYYSQGNIFNKIGSCAMDCDLDLLKEDQEFHNKGERLIEHSVKEKSIPWRAGETEAYSQDISYLEELEKHRFSVCLNTFTIVFLQQLKCGLQAKQGGVLWIKRCRIVHKEYQSGKGSQEPRRQEI